MKFNPALHGFRGLAALIVVVAHWTNEGATLLPFPANNIGKAGVWMFFALSAYLLTDKALDRDYLLNRAFRILPMYWVYILIHWAIGNITNPAQHVLMLDAYWLAWAIPVEVTFYLIMPLVAWLPRRAATSLLLAGICASFITNGVFDEGLSLLPRFAPFALGSLCALWKPKVSEGFGWVALTGLVATIAAVRLAKLDEAAVPDHAISLLMGVTACGVILAIAQGHAVARAFAWRPMVFVGQISFSLYLLHYLFLEHVPNHYIALPAAFVAAYAGYRLVEVPGIRSGHWLAARAGFRRPIPQSAA